MGAYRTQDDLIHDVAEAIVQRRHAIGNKTDHNKEVTVVQNDLTAAMASNNVRFIESLGKR